MAQPTDSDFDLEWFLLQGAVAMRERGTIAGVINQLECGGPSEGGNLDATGAYVHPFTDQQLGTGRCIMGDIERHRWLSAAWFGCSEQTRKLLQLRHTAPRAASRSDSGYGARDRWVEGSDHREGADGLTRTGTDSHLGVLAGLAIQLAPEPDKLLVACFQPEPLHRSGKRVGTVNREEADRRRKLIRDAKARADAAMQPAWAEWFESKAGADPMRRNSERRSPLPVHVAEVVRE